MKQWMKQWMKHFRTYWSIYTVLLAFWIKKVKHNDYTRDHKYADKRHARKTRHNTHMIWDSRHEMKDKTHQGNTEVWRLASQKPQQIGDEPCLRGSFRNFFLSFLFVVVFWRDTVIVAAKTISDMKYVFHELVLMMV